MSKYLVVAAAAMFVLGACGEKSAAVPAADTAAAAAPAPEATTTAPADSMAMPDSAMAADTAHSM